MKSWLEISEGALRANYRALVRAAAAGGGGSMPVLAVVKARAYGHGADLCAGVLASAGAPWLGVADAEEGVLVRRALDRSVSATDAQAGVRGMQPEILLPEILQPEILVMCGSLPEDAEAILSHRLTAVVWSSDQLDALEGARGPGSEVSVHLEVDTGMSRQGVLPGEALDLFLNRLSASPLLRLGGVLTHFASAEVASSPLTELQRKRFEAALEQIAAKGLRPEWIHAGNTSTIDEAGSIPWLRRMAGLYGARPMLRAGLALYGYCLPLKGAQSAVRDHLRPVLAWRSRVLAIEDVPRGATIGYNATFVAPRAMRLGLLPVGYADGLRRELSASDARAGGWVMIRGRRARIVGRISMNLTTVDLSSIPEAAPGDEATLLGEGVSAEDHARLAETIPYEILCGLRARPRLTA